MTSRIVVVLDSSLDSIETADGWFDVFAVAYEVAVARAYRTGGIESAMQMIARAAATARSRKLERLAGIAAAWRVEYLSIAGHLQTLAGKPRRAGSLKYRSAGEADVCMAGTVRGYGRDRASAARSGCIRASGRSR